MTFVHPLNQEAWRALDPAPSLWFDKMMEIEDTKWRRHLVAADPQFCDRRKAGVAGKAVQRCRPIFHDWSVTFSVDLLPGAAITVDDVREAMAIAGSQIGLSDYRPKFGRFEVVSFK